MRRQKRSVGCALLFVICLAHDPNTDMSSSSGMVPFPYGASLRRGRRIYQEDDYRVACFVNKGEEARACSTVALLRNHQSLSLSRLSLWTARDGDAVWLSTLVSLMDTLRQPLM
jgi:hypothetical protein